MQEAKKALDRAKIKLMMRTDLVFFTVVCFSLKILWDKSIPTACTDGKCIIFNPEFFMSLDKHEQLFLLLHETLHVAFMHMLRLYQYNPEKWNKAADYVINDILVMAGLKMPIGGLHDVAYRGMSVKQVYDLLPDEPSGSFSMDLVPGEGNGGEGNGSKEAASKAAEREIADILVRAATQAKLSNSGIGEIPGEIQLYLDGLLDPKLPWHQILRRFMRSMSKSDYSFRKPNRRFFPRHYLPSLYNQGLMEIAVAIDTSGSVSDSDFTQFISEVAMIIKSEKPDKLTLLQFDWNIKSIDSIKTFRDLKNLDFHGRGGTCVEPVIAWAKEKKPAVLLIFTDGWFRMPEITPDTQIIWVIHNNKDFTCDFGKIIHYEV